MSISIPTPENLKEKAKLARVFLKEKCGVDVPHSRCIEMISQLYGFKDWNTATAELTEYAEHERVMALATIQSKIREIPDFVESMTVGDLREALKPYSDDAVIDADYEFNLGEFFNSIDDLHSPQNDFLQEFALTSVTKVDEDYVNLKLTLKNESFSS